MPKYRKKPVVIEAWEWDGTQETYEKLKAEGLPETNVTRPVPTEPPYSLCINTLEGSMEASRGDMIIKGLAGEFYPCKPDIFVKTYTLADDTGADDAPLSEVLRKWHEKAHRHTRDYIAGLFDDFNDEFVVRAFQQRIDSREAFSDVRRLRTIPCTEYNVERVITAKVMQDIDDIKENPALFTDKVDRAINAYIKGLAHFDDLAAIAPPVLYVDIKAYYVEWFLYGYVGKAKKDSK